MSERIHHDCTDGHHQWVISAEVFWSENGGDYRLMWCEKCGESPAPGIFPLALAEEAGKVTSETPLR